MPTPDSPQPGDYCTPEQYRNALRTLELHGTPQMDAWLIHLENEVIDLLPPEHQERFRATQ